VSLGDGAERTYDAVAVANGHHWDPQWPDPPFPGHFDGVELHSHHYIDPREPHELTGKRVVVVGMGNSAMDIACELSRPGEAARVFLSARRGAHVIPHYLFGKPLVAARHAAHWVPWWLRSGWPPGSTGWRSRRHPVRPAGAGSPDRCTPTRPSPATSA
jgi:dimethylaniline monooxygenase (N-oxide forming)